MIKIINTKSEDSYGIHNFVLKGLFDKFNTVVF